LAFSEDDLASVGGFCESGDREEDVCEVEVCVEFVEDSLLVGEADAHTGGGVGVDCAAAGELEAERVVHAAEQRVGEVFCEAVDAAAFDRQQGGGRVETGRAVRVGEAGAVCAAGVALAAEACRVWGPAGPAAVCAEAVGRADERSHALETASRRGVGAGRAGGVAGRAEERAAGEGFGGTPVHAAARSEGEPADCADGALGLGGAGALAAGETAHAAGVCLEVVEEAAGTELGAGTVCAQQAVWRAGETVVPGSSVARETGAVAWHAL